MLRNLKKRLSALASYNRAEKLLIKGDLQGALVELREFEGPPLYEAKACLLQGTIYHKQRKFTNAAGLYGIFLNEHINAISRANDRAYLEMYARYFKSHAVQELDLVYVDTPEAKSLQVLHDKASLATRGEFPFQ